MWESQIKCRKKNPSACENNKVHGIKEEVLTKIQWRKREWPRSVFPPASSSFLVFQVFFHLVHVVIHRSSALLASPAGTSNLKQINLPKKANSLGLTKNSSCLNPYHADSQIREHSLKLTFFLNKHGYKSTSLLIHCVQSIMQQFPTSYISN